MENINDVTKAVVEAPIAKAVVAEEKVEKQAVNVLDLLLGADKGVIKTPYKDVEIPRLSKAFGAPVIVRCEALSPDMYEEIRDRALDINGKDVELDMNVLQTFSVIEGVRVVDRDGKAGGYLLKNGDLMSRFDAASPKELCKMLFLSGEVQKLYDAISNLSGFGEESVIEVKN